MTVEEAQRHRWTAEERDAERKVDVRADLIGGADRVRTRLAELVAASQADEVIVTTNTSDPAERLASYERLAALAEIAPARRLDTARVA
jgi:alkanesulfonate monooxygenase SsuD/methylene tetrahydromethanopterin reductase-like flavin-dependent oxidoreductase (luciferase family)